MGSTGRGDSSNACGVESCVGFLYRAGKVDGAAGVFNDDSFEGEVVAIDGGVVDTEVVGEAAEEEALEPPFAKVAGEAGWCAVIVFEEGGVAVDVAAEAFAEDEFGVGDGEAGVEVGAGGVLDAVVGPEVLGAVGGLNRVGKWLLVVGAGEGDVVARVPVLGEDDVVEFLGEGVEERDD